MINRRAGVPRRVGIRVGLLGGTGLYQLPKAEPIEVETPRARLVLQRTRIGGRETYFLPRHGARHDLAPLDVPHEDHAWALRAARCDYVVGVNNVGSLHPDLAPGTFAVAADFVDLHQENRRRWFGHAPVHTDFSQPYCPTVRMALGRALGAQHPSVVYAGADGPRFETPAEVRALAASGADVVGMTGVPEAVVAREAGLCYATLCFVGNLASGLGKRIKATEVQEGLARRRAPLLKILEKAFRALPQQKACDCARRRADADLRRP